MNSQEAIDKITALERAVESLQARVEAIENQHQYEDLTRGM